MSEKYEQTENGLYIPSMKLLVGGVFDVEHVRDGEVIDQWQSKNLIVNQGLNHILDVVFGNSTQVATWYVALFNTDSTPASTWTYATPVYTESTDYTEGTRPAYVEAAAASQQITNSASKATFTMNTTTTIYGASLVSLSTKGDTAGGGTMMAASKFAASRAVVNTDSLLITYTISAADA
jgi:hypothetical protein